jgi:hypothetical protein
VERERPLREVKTLDPDAEFYHYKYKIQVVGDKDKLSPVEDWKVYGSPYVCVEKAPPKGRKLEPIVEGILKKECIEVKNPPENISGRVEDTANIMSFVRLGLTLDLQAPPKRERKSRKKK